ncbi:hypothetical protein CLAIMM_13512 [Cladophialophora immunda]|nr:hypothetical protein CLAIMM_13512 [Cladophialophora immunda]
MHPGRAERLTHALSKTKAGTEGACISEHPSGTVGAKAALRPALDGKNNVVRNRTAGEGGHKPLPAEWLVGDIVTDRRWEDVIEDGLVGENAGGREKVGRKTNSPSLPLRCYRVSGKVACAHVLASRDYLQGDSEVYPTRRSGKLHRISKRRLV